MQTRKNQPQNMDLIGFLADLINGAINIVMSYLIKAVMTQSINRLNETLMVTASTS